MKEGGRRPTPRARLGKGALPSDLFWTGFFPFLVLACLASSALLFVLAGVVLSLRVSSLLTVAALGCVCQLALVLPASLYLIHTRLDAPLMRFSQELEGTRSWSPEGDHLLAPLRTSVGLLRARLQDAQTALEEQRAESDENRRRFAQEQAGAAFAEHAENLLMPVERLDELAAVMTELVREAFPAEHALVYQSDRVGSGFELLRYERAGEVVPADEVMSYMPDLARYHRSSLPLPLKEGLRRGFYEESGLPFSPSAALPGATSFVCLSLRHRGGVAGLLLAASADSPGGGGALLRRIQPLLSCSFSRSLYLREREEAEIRDPVTGGYTARHFLSLLDAEVSRANRYGRVMSCILLRVDQIESIVRVHGEEASERVLSDVAGLIFGLIRSSDCLARLSADEMAVLLPETPAGGGFQAAERIRTRIEEYPFLVERGALEHITVSAGVSFHPPHGVTPQALLKAGRSAAALAHGAGGNRVVSAEEPVNQPEYEEPVNGPV